MADFNVIKGKTGVNSRILDSTKFSKNFLVFISSHQHGQVVARCPERVSLSIQSEWDTVLGGGVSKFFNFALQETLDVSANTRFSTAQHWTGNAPLELTLPLEFYAEDNVTTEVIDPVVMLAKMALPRLDGNFYRPPGPRVFGNLKKRAGFDDKSDYISVAIPEFLNLQNIIVTGVAPDFVTRDMHNTGPLRASCSVTFRTLYAFTQADIESTFVNSTKREK